MRLGKWGSLPLTSCALAPWRAAPCKDAPGPEGAAWEVAAHGDRGSQMPFPSTG